MQGSKGRKNLNDQFAEKDLRERKEDRAEDMAVIQRDMRRVKADMQDIKLMLAEIPPALKTITKIAKKLQIEV